MILSTREIRAAIRCRSIGLTNCPPNDSPRWTSTTVDLTLDAEIRVWEDDGNGGMLQAIDPMSRAWNSNRLIERHTRVCDCTNGFVLHGLREDGAGRPPAPAAGMESGWRFVLGWTVEKLRLPHTSKIAARVEGKSSLARIGLGIHVTAPTIHAGFGHIDQDPNFEGNPIRLEIWNIGVFPIILRKGMPICQLIFEEVHGTPDEGYEGQFTIQGPGSPP